MRRRNWTVPYALFLLVFVIVPLLLIVLYAFTDDGGAFTLANFRKFMMHPEAMNTFVYSIGIAVITTLVCLLLGYPAAYILSQKQFNTSRTMVGYSVNMRSQCSMVAGHAWKVFRSWMTNEPSMALL